METELIRITDFCQSHEIKESFLIELRAYELVKLETRDNQVFIHLEELSKVEKMVRLHHDLKINLAGIQAIYHLLERTQKMQNEIRLLKNRLKRHSD
jgi:hypothetical protein